MKIQIKLLDKRFGNEWPLPSYATDGSAAIDLRATKFARLFANKYPILMPTGIAVNIKDVNICAQLLPRSGLGHTCGVILGNGTGLIDSDYQKEIFVSLWNRSPQDYDVKSGDRIAQMVFLPIVKAEFDFVTDFDSYTDRGGFGSTGIN